jgi:cell division protease FtsH
MTLPSTPQRRNRRSLRLLLILILILVGWPLIRTRNFETKAVDQPLEIPYSTFIEQVEADNVTMIAVRGSRVEGFFRTFITWPPQDWPSAEVGRSPRSSVTFVTTLSSPDDPALIALLSQHNVIVMGTEEPPSPFLILLLNIGPLPVILLLVWVVYRMRRAREA